jgi:hypothetical protein
MLFERSCGTDLFVLKADRLQVAPFTGGHLIYFYGTLSPRYPAPLAPVAQGIRVSPSEGEGRRFKSCRAHQIRTRLARRTP